MRSGTIWKPARDQQAGFGPLKFEDRTRLGTVRRLAMRPLDDQVGILENGLLGIGRFAVVLQGETAAEARDGSRHLEVEEPVDDVERMLAEIGHLTAGRVPEPAEMIDAAIRVVWPLGGRAEPHIPVEFRRRIAICGRPEAGHDVAI